MDEVSIYNRPLTASEIASIYNAGPAGKQLVPPIILSVRAQGSTVLLSFPAALGITYTVQATPSHSPASWSVLTNITATNTIVGLTVPVAGSPQGFYRVTTASH